MTPPSPASAHAIARRRRRDVTVLKTANTCGKLNAMDPQAGPPGHRALGRGLQRRC
ncbi:MAG: hypothetical protein ACLTSX_06275 [Collinsella sp.]